jgi:hypothetical protein
VSIEKASQDMEAGCDPYQRDQTSAIFENLLLQKISFFPPTLPSLIAFLVKK